MDLQGRLFLIISHIIQKICWRFFFQLLQPQSSDKSPTTHLCIKKHSLSKKKKKKKYVSCSLLCTERQGFTHRKMKQVLMTIMIINIETSKTRSDQGSTKPHTKSLKAAGSCPVVPRFFVLTLWSLTTSVVSSAVPQNHLTSPFTFPLASLFHRSPNPKWPTNTPLAIGNAITNVKIWKCYLGIIYQLQWQHILHYNICLGITKSIINHKCSQMMDFIIGSVT